MDGVLDGKPHKCIAVDSKNPNFALFEGVIPNAGDSKGLWAWGLHQFKEVPPSGEFAVGDKVKVKDSVLRPEHGWGEVRHGHIGTIIRIYSNNEMMVDFPRQKHWHAEASEMEKVEA